MAVLGAGTIGSAMVRTLLRAGYPVNAWSRTEQMLEPLAEEGATACRTPAEAVAGASHVITALADGPAISRVMDAPDGAAGGLMRGALWLQMSTVGLSYTERFSNQAAYLSVEFVDAPVVGSKQPAEQGELLILASGSAVVQSRAQPVFDVLGRRTFWLGPVGAGTRMKLVVNTWVTNCVAALAETISLAEAMGVDPEEFFALLADSPVDMRYGHVKGRAMIDRNFEPSFALRLAEKDLRLILEAAVERDLRLPVTEAAARQYRRALDLGHQDDDLAAVIYAVREPEAGETHSA